ncbi:MAG: glycosyltransferase [Gemmatimonadetes bacterium]|nr:glycosyltransferase [Gemmatimonadota bacterium]NNM07449.1 glycosyltransferase [Gemmatimonadota bacterium]
MWRQVVIVVPCYNESARLRLDLFASFAAGSNDLGFLFVNDGSTDASAEVLSSAVADHPEHFATLSLPRNVGKGEAVRAGLRQAVSNGASVVGFWDADLATPLAELPGMLAVLDGREGIEGVLGARVRLLGRSVERRRSRHYLGRVFGTLASVVLRLPVYDTQCGAKVFVVTDELIFAIKEPFCSRWIFDVELLGRLRAGWGGRAHERLEEYPLRSWADVDGSKLRGRHFLRAAWDLLRIWRQMSQGRAEEENGA